MTRSIDKNISRGASIISLVTIALFPLFMLPTTTNFYDPNKTALLIIASCLLLILYAVKTVLTKTLRFELLPLIAPILILGLIYFISPFIVTPNNAVDALMNRGSFFIALGIFVAATVNLVTERRFIRQASYALIGSGTILAIITLFQSFGFGLSNLINKIAGTNLPNSLVFTPAGSPVALLTFLIPMVALGLVLAFTKTDAGEKVALFVLSAIMASAILVVSVYSLPGKDTAPLFLPFRAGYAIAIDTLKTPKTAIFGVGSNSFVVAYNQLRPGIMNTDTMWNIRFGYSSTEVLQLITTIGLLGLAAFLSIIVGMIKFSKSTISSIQIRSLKVAAFTIAILFFLVPGNLVLYFAFAVVLGLWSMAVKFGGLESIKTAHLELDPDSSASQTIKKIGVYAPPTILIGIVVASLYFGTKVYGAEMTFKKSLDAAAQNDGLTTYNLQRDAILANPYLPRYRRAYAATNLALANALASNQEITDEDRQNVAQLIQQSIREAKVAASLEPENATNWENLAGIYRALINAADGADQWTVAALAQAIQTDPINPALRIELGGVYYSLGAYDQSIRLFQQAAELKPNYANAYYNLSHAYQQKQDVVSAYDYMRQTLSLTAADSADYTKAKEELEALSKLLPKQDQQQAAGQNQQLAPAQTNLQVAPPAPSPANEVDLPANAGPEDVPTSPTTPLSDINP